MKIYLSRDLPIYRYLCLSFACISLLILGALTIVKAQPTFSQDGLQLLKQRKLHPDFSRYQTAPEAIPLAKSTLNNKTSFADGDLDPTFNATVSEGTGYVDDIAILPDGKMIIAGYFQRVNGTTANGIALLNADGSLNLSFNSGTGANSFIRTIAVQPDGKVLVGGSFTTFNGQTVSRIVRLNPLGDIDTSFSTSVTFNNTINDIVVLSDGRIMVGGNFSVSSSRLVVLNSNGTLSTAISGFSSQVYKIAVQADGKILVGSSSSTNGLRRLNTDFTADSTFNVGTGPNSAVFDVVVQADGKIVLGGVFTSFNGTATDEIVRINSDGSLNSTFEFLSDQEIQNAEVDALAIQPDGKILASYFYFNDSGYLGRISRFNTNATTDGTFTVGDLSGPQATGLTVLGDGKFLVGGAFVSYNNQTRLHIAKLNQDGTFDNTFNSAVSAIGIVYAIKRQADGKIIIGGDFDFVNGVRKSGLARLNADGTLDNTFSIGSSFYGDIYALEIQPDGKIIIGGLFNGGANFPGYAAARINSDGSFNVNLNSDMRFVSVAYTVGLQSDGKILVAGQILDETFANLLPANRMNSDGSLDMSFNPPSFNSSLGIVRALTVQPNNKIIIGGQFFSVTGFPRNGIARLNTDGTLDSAFSASIGNAYALKQTTDGKVYAAGTTLTRFSSEGVVDSTLNVGTGFNSVIRAVEVQPDGKILLGGVFTAYNGFGVFHFTRINANGSIDPNFTAGTTGFIYALNLQQDGKILAGGQFFDFNSTEKFSLVRLKNAAIPRATPFDFDGDSKTDISIFRSSVGEWWYQRSSDGQVPAVQFGSSTDKPVPADFTGDGKTDVAFWRPSSGEWFILRSEDSGYLSFPFGASGDVPQVGDFDADGKADPTVFRPSTGEWFISKSTGGTVITTFGQAGDLPVAADFDGDGRVDIAIFRPSDGSWWYLRSSDNQFRVFRFGVGTDKPVPGDYTGDGKADIAVFRPSTGEWFFQRSEDNSYYSVPFGASGDIPAPGDYDGDGRFDTAVFRPAGSTWYINRTTAGLLIQQFGLATDTPVPSAFVP